MARLDALFKILKDQGASDLHLAAGIPPHLRRHGVVAPVADWPVFTNENLRAHLQELTSEKQWAHYTSNLDLDFAYAIPGLARFRANFFNQEHGAARVPSDHAGRQAGFGNRIGCNGPAPPTLTNDSPCHWPTQGCAMRWLFSIRMVPTMVSKVPDPMARIRAGRSSPTCAIACSSTSSEA